jgi:hypothetical protein
MRSLSLLVIPAKAGIHGITRRSKCLWTPACAGMKIWGNCHA